MGTVSTRYIWKPGESLPTFYQQISLHIFMFRYTMAIRKSLVSCSMRLVVTAESMWGPWKPQHSRLWLSSPGWPRTLIHLYTYSTGLLVSGRRYREVQGIGVHISLEFDYRCICHLGNRYDSKQW